METGLKAEEEEFGNQIESIGVKLQISNLKNVVVLGGLNLDIKSKGVAFSRPFESDYLKQKTKTLISGKLNVFLLSVSVLEGSCSREKEDLYLYPIMAFYQKKDDWTWSIFFPTNVEDCEIGSRTCLFLKENLPGIPCEGFFLGDLISRNQNIQVLSGVSLLNIINESYSNNIDFKYLLKVNKPLELRKNEIIRMEGSEENVSEECIKTVESVLEDYKEIKNQIDSIKEDCRSKHKTVKDSSKTLSEWALKNKDRKDPMTWRDSFVIRAPKSGKRRITVSTAKTATKEVLQKYGLSEKFDKAYSEWKKEKKERNKSEETTIKIIPINCERKQPLREKSELEEKKLDRMKDALMKSLK